jgi:release factor glutamine methyltransferase
VTLGALLRESRELLDHAGVDSPRLDAELIAAHALRLSRLELAAGHDRELAAADADAVRALVARRAAREPLAYVLGEWGFRRLVLRTDARALVPRPETEVVVDRALAAIAGVASPSVIDVGAGTGAIALALAEEQPDARVTATDISADALALARENADRLGLAVELVHGSLLAGLAGPFDLVVSNPPYVLPAELETLEPEVRDWEPRAATVDAGQTGELVRAARHALAPGGAIVLECHADGADGVAALLADAGYGPTTITRDLAGRERVVEARWQPTESSRR